jgi:hypothetical protein
MRGAGLISLIAVILLWPGVLTSRAAEEVDLLLVLSSDVSRSIDTPKFKLQREGYAAAIVDPRVSGHVCPDPLHCAGADAEAGCDMIVIGSRGPGSIHCGEKKITQFGKSISGHVSVPMRLENSCL